MSIVIIDYGSGNLHSAANSFARAAENTGRAVEVSADPRTLESATHIVLPGVGAFADCMAGLRAVPGLVEALQREVIDKQKWFFGICVGMQLMMQWGNEHGRHEGLGWIEGEVVPIAPGSGFKIPHMGWNDLTIASHHPLFEGIATGDHAYFVHSYHAKCAHGNEVLATAEYGSERLTAAVARGNLMGTQFHPEKSQKTGLRLIENFVRMPPK